MGRALQETNRRRAIQQAYNDANGIVPQTIVKPIDMSLVAVAEGDYVTVPLDVEPESAAELTAEERDALIAELEAKMREAAKAFEFEKAAQYRDKMRALKSGSIYEEPVAAARTGNRG
ncbi:MAG: UvrB/UvrC motif-containing protein, partial [Acidobacteriaceae bacterium]|nr:UvrB/UvrC motif-containing protein [Acidobacteriaceae bacterium]